MTDLAAAGGAGDGAGGRETLPERLAVAAYSGMERLATSLPPRVGRAAFAALAAVAHRIAPGSRATVADNLAHVLGLPPSDPLVRAATREAFSLYGRYWHETFHSRVLPREELFERFHMEGLEHVDAAMEAGRGIILSLPHMGNWDVAGQYVAALGYRVVAVAEDLRPPRLARLFLAHREALGMEILVLNDSKDVGLRLAQLLSENAVVALVADRDLGGRGVDVEMFGAPRKIPAGPALLSLSTGAPLGAASVFTTHDGWRCHIGPPLEIERSGSLREDVAALTRLLAAEFERGIAAAPTDWHMFQPAWPADRSAPQRASLLAPE